MQETPHPRNADGEFYVVDGCCLLCGVPEYHAPDIFEWVGGPPAGDSCFVARQPETGDQINRVLRAITDQEANCIRYKGTDRRVQRALVRSGRAAQCDELSLSNRLLAWLLDRIAA